jgi:hypothetical protein
VYYDANGRVEFLESFSVPGTRHVLLGISAFESTADSLLETASGRFALREEEIGTSFVSASPGLSLWRQSEEDETFEAIGVAVDGYF